MVVKYIVDAFLAAINALFTLIPGISFPTLTTPPAILANLYPFSRIVPLAWLFTCIGITITIKGVLLLWDGTLFVYHQFWGSN